MEFKVKKGVSKEPLLWGLKIPQFISFIAIVIICVFTLVGGLSIRKILVVGTVTGGSYLILKLASQRNVIKFLFSDRFPEILKNDL